jgi:hypothetical protein
MTSFPVFLPAEMKARRFHRLGKIDDNGACSIVRDHSGQALAYVYYEDDLDQRLICSRAMRHGALRSISPSCRTSPIPPPASPPIFPEALVPAAPTSSRDEPAAVVPARHADRASTDEVLSRAGTRDR